MYGRRVGRPSCRLENVVERPGEQLEGGEAVLGIGSDSDRVLLRVTLRTVALNE